MDKLFPLGVWLLLFVETARSLTCYKCFREFNNGTCRTAEETCVANRGESCFRQHIIAENVPLYTSAGCILNCKEVNAGLHIFHINRCCSKNMCNKT